jgi:membrane protein DedA with SNARE-associated domain
MEDFWLQLYKDLGMCSPYVIYVDVEIMCGLSTLILIGYKGQDYFFNQIPKKNKNRNYSEDLIKQHNNWLIFNDTLIWGVYCLVWSSIHFLSSKKLGGNYSIENLQHHKDIVILTVWCTLALYLLFAIEFFFMHFIKLIVSYDKN